MHLLCYSNQAFNINLVAGSRNLIRIVICGYLLYVYILKILTSLINVIDSGIWLFMPINTVTVTDVFLWSIFRSYQDEHIAYTWKQWSFWAAGNPGFVWESVCQTTKTYTVWVLQPVLKLSFKEAFSQIIPLFFQQ